MDVMGLIKSLSIPTLIVFFLYFVIKNPEKIQIWVSMLQKIYAWASKEPQKRAISNEIEGKLNLYSRRVNEESGLGEIMPYSAKLHWIEDSMGKFNKETFVANDHVVIKMTYHQNREKNLSLATVDYVSKGLVPKGRVYVSKKIMKSIDLKMAQKMLNMSGSHSAVECFLEEVLPPWLKDPDIKLFYAKLHPIDDRGFFITILLNEILILGKTIPLDDESKRQRAISEVKNFVLFLDEIATRKRNEEVELDFVKKEIRVGLLLIAREELKQWYGVEPYLKRFKKKIQNGTERIYLFARDRNIPFAREIVHEIEKKEEKAGKIIEKEIKVTNEKGKLVKGYFSLFQIIP